MFKKIFASYFVLSLLCLAAFRAHAQNIIHKGEQFGLMDSTGTYLLPLEYDNIQELLLYKAYRTRIYQYRKNNKYGLYNFRTKENSGPLFDTIVCGRNGGTYLLNTGDLWGFVIEPEIRKFSWVLPQYKEVHPMCEGLNPFVPNPYEHDYQHKAFNVRNDALWGLASYYENKILVPMEYEFTIRVSTGTDGSLYVSYNRKVGGGYLIHPQTLVTTKVQEPIMGKRYGDYFADTYWVNDVKYIRVFHLPTGKTVFEVNCEVFERMHTNFRLINSNTLEINGEAKRKFENKEEKTICIWYSLNSGEEVLRLSTTNCREIRTGGKENPNEIWSIVTCGSGKNKLLGNMVYGKFVPLK